MPRLSGVVVSAFAALCFAGLVAAGGSDLGSVDHVVRTKGVPLGVDPANADRYRTETFQCDGGSKSIDFAKVNDDYCDCADGSDEPGTSACSNGWFHCRNRGAQSLNVPSSRVRDGVCDCCDGSDERGGLRAQCPNTCADAGASRRETLRKEAKDYRKGLVKKTALIAAAPSERQKWLQKLERLTREVEVATSKANALRDAHALAKQEHDTAKAEAEKFEVVDALDDAKDDDGGDVVESSSDAWDGDPSEEVSPDALDLEANAAGDLGDPTSDPDPSVAPEGETDEERGQRIARQWIKTDSESTSDTFADDPADDSEDDFKDDPEDSADSRRPNLVDVDDDAFVERRASAKRKSAVARGSPFSLRFWFPKKSTRSENGKPASPEEKAASARFEKARSAQNAASESLRSAEEHLNALRSELDRVRDDVSRDVGESGEFQHMLGACYSAKVDKYEYAVCPFGEAKQDSTRLGRMEPLVSDARDRPEGYAFRFVDGESCWNGPKRSIEVSLRCGNEPRLFGVAEPSRCEYSAVLETPAVCQEVVAEALEKELAELEKDVADLARGEEYELR